MGVTSELSHFGQGVLLVGMFVGRLDLAAAERNWDAMSKSRTICIVRIESDTRTRICMSDQALRGDRDEGMVELEPTAGQ